MTEPVAYKIEDVSETLGWRYSTLKPVNKNYIALYTSEQLHPRVKMTQAEFETFKNIKQKNNLLSDALSATTFFGNEKQQSEKQIEFANLFINLDLNNPEETIEIVPDMKWFVRSKEKYEADIVQGLPESGYLYLTDGGDYSIEYREMTTFKDDATRFDTKEEAEKWTNPLTEAVQLPVEE